MYVGTVLLYTSSMAKFNKKHLEIIIFILLILGGYLLLAHKYIYYALTVASLTPTSNDQAYIMKGISQKTIKYAALGDSLTSGTGVSHYEQSFPYLIANRLGQNGATVELRNFSYPGARTDGLVVYKLSEALAYQPEVVTLLIGTNDVHGLVGVEVFKKNYELILKKLTTETKAKVYAISIPKIGSRTLLLPPYFGIFSQEIDKYNLAIQELAAQYKIEYVDITTSTADQFAEDGAHYASDKFHPSAEGYKIWADIISRSMK